MNPSILRDLFVCNVLRLYRPFIYHKFQSDDLNETFSKFGLNQLTEIKQRLVNTTYYHLGRFEQELKSEREKGTIKLSESKLDEFFAHVRRIVEGASLKNSGMTPHWFDAAFKSRWHARLEILNNQLLRTNVPELLAMDGETISYFDATRSEKVTINLRTFFGKHYDSISYLFKIPFYYFKVETNFMPWYHFSSTPFYDGICVTQTKGGRNYDWNREKIEFVPAKVSRFIAIHPIELLSADVFGWEELVKQTVWHELCHVLQEAYINTFMFYAVLKGQYVNNPSVDPYKHIKAIAADLDQAMLEKVLQANMARLYIVEKIQDMPPEERVSYNLNQYSQERGGHTLGFKNLVEKLDIRQTAMKQRNLFMFNVIGPVMYRVYGQSPGSGQVWS
jgi:hypothetical protein